MLRQIELICPIHLPLETVRCGHKVLIIVDLTVIVGDPQGIIDQQLMPHPHLLNIIILLIGFIITLNEGRHS
jgi:hypothetical protein